jgi:hypothetical protein
VDHSFIIIIILYYFKYQWTIHEVSMFDDLTNLRIIECQSNHLLTLIPLPNQNVRIYELILSQKKKKKKETEI